MKQDILILATQAFGDKAATLYMRELEKFAELAAAAEREACREIAFRMAHSDEDAVDVSHAIRARGET